MKKVAYGVLGLVGGMVLLTALLAWLVPEDEVRFAEYQRGPVTGSAEDDYKRTPTVLRPDFPRDETLLFSE